MVVDTRLLTLVHFIVFLFVRLIILHMQRQQSRQRPSLRYAQSVASLRNSAKPVVVVAAVLGPESAEVLVIQNLITRGTRAFGHVKHDSSRRRRAHRCSVPSPKSMPLLMMPTWVRTPKQSSRPLQCWLLRQQVRRYYY